MTRPVAISHDGFFARLGAATGGSGSAWPAGSLQPLLSAPGEGLRDGDAPEAVDVAAWPTATPPRSMAELVPSLSVPSGPDLQATAEMALGPAVFAPLDIEPISRLSMAGEAGQSKDRGPQPAAIRTGEPAAPPEKHEDRRDGPPSTQDGDKPKSGQPPERLAKRSPPSSQAPAPVYSEQAGVRRKTPTLPERPATIRSMTLPSAPPRDPAGPQTTIEIHIGSIELRGRQAPVPTAPVTAQQASSSTDSLSAYLARRTRGHTT